jgi:hypothetical protein
MNILKTFIKLILEQDVVRPSNRGKTSNKPEDLRKGYSVEDVTRDDFYYQSFVGEDGVSKIVVYSKNEKGGKGDYLYTLDGDSPENIRISNPQFITNRSKNKIK